VRPVCLLSALGGGLREKIVVKVIQFVLLLAMSSFPFGSQEIPGGTILPVQLDSTLSRQTLAGQALKATVMQDVPLTNGTRIPAGAKVLGEVTAVDSSNSGLRISLKFDQLTVDKTVLPILTNLRALASRLEIDGAQLPLVGSDRGTPANAYTTVQVGGNDVVYRGGGHVMSASDVVGEPVREGVLAHPRANLVRGCRGTAEGNVPVQAMWVFDSDACGVYGFDSLRIVSTGRSIPLGEITLVTARSDLKIRGGSGMLLRVLSRNK
jgi:hypothetical protein